MLLGNEPRGKEQKMNNRILCKALGLLLVVGIACGDDDDDSGNGYPPGSSGGTGDGGDGDGGDDGGDDGSGDGGSDGGGSDDGGDDGGDDGSGDGGSDGGDGSDGGASELPPGFDRDAPNLLDKDGLCGYPSEGDSGYGNQIGQRIQNMVLHDCAGNEFELGELLCELDNGHWRHAFVFTLYAMWCPNCVTEAEQIALLQGALTDADVGIVQIMNENSGGGAPSSSDCSAWMNGSGLQSPPVFMLTDPDNDFWQAVNGGQSIPLPYNVYANANLEIKAVDEGWQGRDHLINTLNWILEEGP
jgi:hypothetical protein